MAPKDFKELYFEHTLDAAWIIILWHWIHGGDPFQRSEAAQTTELLARALAGHMGRGRNEIGDVVAKLGQLGIKLTIQLEGKDTEVKTTKELHDYYLAGHDPFNKICAQFMGGNRTCFGPIIPFPEIPVKVPGRQ
jgi:hypothetical protein